MQATLESKPESREEIEAFEPRLAAPAATTLRPALSPIWPADSDRPVEQRKLSFTESLLAVACLRVGILPRVTGRRGN
jgi:hypothetical protein